VIKVNALSYALLIKALRQGDMTLAELAEETGLHYLTVALYTRALHKVGEVHISGWAPDLLGRLSSKLYKLGPGRDAKRQPLTQGERQQRRRDKRRAVALIQRTAGPLGLLVPSPATQHRSEHAESL
jgi:hypothetical protein